MDWLSAGEERRFELCLKFITVDFELAIITALLLKFSTVRVCGFLFHLGLSIYWDIQKNRLVEAYQSNDETSLSLRKLSALTLLPPDEIPDAFNLLSNNAPDEVAPVYKYFGENNVLGKPYATHVRGRPTRSHRRHPPRFSPNFWSVLILQENNLPRTNNGLEAWHRRFETVVERYHLGMFSMIREFLKENYRTNQEVQRIIAGNIAVKTMKEQLQREERITTVGSIPVDEYLWGIAQKVQLTTCHRFADESQADWHLSTYLRL